MNEKIINVFFDTNCLPYKDVERQVHFPITGSAFLGASNTTKIRFYFDQIGNSNVTWVAVAKLPNGKQGSKVLSVSEDSELDENYAELQLDSWYTQAKGDVYIALQGYQGGVEYSYDSETELYEIHGTPTIQTTGSIKLAINYAPIGQVADYTDEFTTYQEILAGLGDKLDITSGIIVVNDITQVVATTYEDGQVFYNLADRKLYQLDSSSFVVFQPYVAISSEPIPQSDFDIILAHKEYPILYGSYVFWYYGEDTLALRYARNDLDVSSNTFTTTKQQLIIFKSTREYDLLTQNAETYNKSKIDTELSGKQDTLVSGVNIATINHLSLLDNTNIDIQGGSGGGAWGEITGDIQDQADLQAEFQNVREIAEGKSKTLVLSYLQTAPTSDLIATSLRKEDGTRFTDLADFNAYVSGYTLANSSFNSQDNSILIFNYYVITSDDYVLRLPYIYANFKRGDIFLITQTDVPDRWISTPMNDRTYFSKLETSKVDLDNYATKTELAFSVGVANNNIAPEYDDSIGYVVGDKTIHGGELYTCNTPITTPESWDSTHWSQITVASGFVDLDKAQVISGEKTFSGGIRLSSETLIDATSNSSYIDFKTGGSDTRRFRIGSTTYATCNFMPSANNTYNLGSSNNASWKDLYLSGNANVGGDVNLADGTSNGVVFPFNDGSYHWKINYQSSLGNKLQIARYQGSVLQGGFNFGTAIFTPNSNNAADLGNTNTKWRNLYFGGKINDNAYGSGYGLTLPDTTNFTANKEIATTDQLFNVINASDIENNTLTQAQYDLITNGKPTLISGTFLSINNPLIAGIKVNGIYGYKGVAISSEYVGVFEIDTSNICYLRANYNQSGISLGRISKINDKSIPNYPSNTGTFTLKCVDGVLTWVAE